MKGDFDTFGFITASVMLGVVAIPIAAVLGGLVAWGLLFAHSTFGWVGVGVGVGALVGVYFTLDASFRAAR